MADQKTAKGLPDPMTWGEAYKKYDGDYDKIIEASKRTDRKVTKRVSREASESSE